MLGVGASAGSAEAGVSAPMAGDGTGLMLFVVAADYVLAES